MEEHKIKRCRSCQQEKDINDFPVHTSSFDGHRHDCAVCTAEQQTHKKIRQAQWRQQEREQRIQQEVRRARENRLFRAYGYTWKKELVERWEDVEEAWVLHTPVGQQITTENALQEIAHLQVHHPGHESALWARDLLTRPVLLLDTETTGFDDQAEIIEIALVDGKGRPHLNTLVQCQCEAIPVPALRVHRIHKAMLHNAPAFPQLWPGLLKRFAVNEIVIYNADYDLRMLRQTAARYGLELPPMRVHCLMERYSAYVGCRLPSHSEQYRSMKLAAACLHFQIEQPDAHRALADAQSSLLLLQGLASYAE